MSAVAWLAWCDAVPPGAWGSAEVAEGGRLVAWRQEQRPPGARRVDPRVLDRDGAALVVSLVLPDEEALMPFDDLAVQHARRRLLQEPPAELVSTLLVDDRRFAGALTGHRGPQAERMLRDDPFARLGPRRLLRVGPGLLGSSAPPAGPVIERHGSAQPWPWDRF